MESSTEVTTNL